MRLVRLGLDAPMMRLRAMIWRLLTVGGQSTVDVVLTLRASKAGWLDVPFEL